MRRTVVTGLLLIPAGAVVGFSSCAVIALGYDLISSTLKGVAYSTGEMADNGIGITLAAMLGGAVGAVVTPIIYLIGFTRVGTRQLALLISLIALATVAPGLIGAFLGPNAALFTTVVGFVGSCATAYAYIMDHTKGRDD